MLGRTFEEASGSALSLLAPEVHALLRGELVTGNLECLITEARVPNPASHATFRTQASFAQPLVSLFDVLTLANNHVYDFFDDGIRDTLRHLKEWGVAAVGVGESEADAIAPALLPMGERTAAVFGMATAVPEPPQGSAFVVARPNARALERLREAHEKGLFVVVHLHAGGGDIVHPAPEVRHLHTKILAAGAAVVLGHHPHCPQGWLSSETHAQFFSLGDFVFDKFEGRRDEALVVHVAAGEGLEVSVHPVKRNADYVVERPEASRTAALNAEYASWNEALETGRSDALFFAGSAVLGKVQRDAFVEALRAGKWNEVLEKMRRVGWRRVFTVLRTILRSYRGAISR